MFLKRGVEKRMRRLHTCRNSLVPVTSCSLTARQPTKQDDKMSRTNYTGKLSRSTNENASHLLPESRRTKYVHMRPIVRHHVTPKPCNGKKLCQHTLPLACCPGTGRGESQEWRLSLGRGRVERGLLPLYIEIDAHPFRYIVNEPWFRKDSCINHYVCDWYVSSDTEIC